MLLERFSGLHSTYIDQHSIYTNFIAIPAIAIYYFALRDKRENYFEGVMTYKQGFITGAFVTLFFTLISPITQFLIAEMVSPDFFDNMIMYVTENDIMTRDDAESYFSLTSYIIQGLIGAPIMGLITTGIVAVFTKNS